MAEKEHDNKEKATEGGEEKKSSKMLLIIIIAVLVLILVIGGVIIALMSGGEEAATSGHKKEASAHGEEAPADGEHAKSEKSGGHGEESLSEVGIMFPMELFTVNLLSESGRRYLKVEMNLELEGEELAVELETKKPVLRDVIIRILSGKSLEEVSTIKGKEAVKEEILSDLNARVKDGKIKNVYFTDFVVQ